jgi:histone acetyltransferase (RNA polymerase elongator complex component)
MKHSNISIFIPHVGCPHQCSFCDQRTISGAQHLPDGDEVREICEKALAEVKSPENTEIAFFGGSFTAIPRDYMNELLDAAKEYVGSGKFRGIRCSTRPDCIDSEILGILARSGVTAIELGAQSMSDKVLEANERGHSAEDVENAAKLIKQWGFELGLQMMIGLYRSTREDELLTMHKIAELQPDTARIYPTVILKGTRLAELLESGEYVTFSFEEAVEMAASGLVMFEGSGIRVIKCGLHASEFVEKDMVGGFYHPAFRELCEGMIYRYNMEFQLKQTDSRDVIFAVNDTCISKAGGHKKANIDYFSQQGINVKIIGDKSIPKYQCELRR